MTYRDDTESVRAENERLRAENAALRSTRWRRWALAAVVLALSIAAILLVRRGGAGALGVTTIALVFLWLPAFFKVRLE